MAEVAIMPELGFNMGGGQLVKWHKQMGEKVKKGEVLFEINTDRITMLVETTEDGILLKIILEESALAEVFTPIAVTDAPGKDPGAALASAGQRQAGGNAPTAAPSAPATPADMKSLKLTPGARKLVQDEGINPAFLTQTRGTGFQGGITYKDLKASPLARRVAQQMNVDLVVVQGAGATGKIMRTDMETAPASVGADTQQVISAVPYKDVHRIIGEKLAQSESTVPHLYLTDVVNIIELTTFRKRPNETSEVKITVSNLLTMATCKALKKFPGISVALEDGQAVTYKSTNVGIAMADDNGLVVPVIKGVQNKTLTDVARESKDLVARAREGRLAPEEYSESILSISSLGIFDIGNFTAIINAPESTILSVSSVRKIPVMTTDEGREDAIAIWPMINIRLPVGHRIIGGLLTSQFMEYMKQLLKYPIQILV